MYRFGEACGWCYMFAYTAQKLQIIRAVTMSERNCARLFRRFLMIPPVVQVSEQSFAVFGLPTASNLLGFCHLKKEGKTKVGYICTANDCRHFALKAKGITVEACCLHLRLLFASLDHRGTQRTLFAKCKILLKNIRLRHPKKQSNYCISLFLFEAVQDLIWKTENHSQCVELC